jgi:hypothetical protein
MLPYDFLTWQMGYRGSAPSCASSCFAPFMIWRGGGTVSPTGCSRLTRIFSIAAVPHEAKRPTSVGPSCFLAYRIGRVSSDQWELPCVRCCLYQSYPHHRSAIEAFGALNGIALGGSTSDPLKLALGRAVDQSMYGWGGCAIDGATLASQTEAQLYC